jgi:hypothetical protein
MSPDVHDYPDESGKLLLPVLPDVRDYPLLYPGLERKFQLLPNYMKTWSYMDGICYEAKRQNLLYSTKVPCHDTIVRATSIT